MTYLCFLCGRCFGLKTFRDFADFSAVSKLKHSLNRNDIPNKSWLFCASWLQVELKSLIVGILSCIIRFHDIVYIICNDEISHRFEEIAS